MVIAKLFGEAFVRIWKCFWNLESFKTDTSWMRTIRKFSWRVGYKPYTKIVDSHRYVRQTLTRATLQSSLFLPYWPVSWTSWFNFFVSGPNIHLPMVVWLAVWWKVIHKIFVKLTSNHLCIIFFFSICYERRYYRLTNLTLQVVDLKVFSWVVVKWFALMSAVFCQRCHRMCLKASRCFL